MTATAPVQTIAVIGTAGRGDDGKKWSAPLFQRMVDMAKHIIERHWKQTLGKCILVSGGAAGGDHVAVRLTQSNQDVHLTLHLPSKWNETKACYDPSTYEGKRSNQLHRQFSDAIGDWSLDDLQSILKKTDRVQVQSHKSFFDRNRRIAEADYMIAFTWSNTLEPKDGGTHYTWKLFKSKENKIHVPMSFLQGKDWDAQKTMDRIRLL